MALPAHLATAYTASTYKVAGLTLTVGRRSSGLDGLLAGIGAREAVLITAWNPSSRRMPPRWNDRMMAALRDRLGDAPSLPAQSRLRGWGEEHLVVAGSARRLGVLGRHFRQAAILRLVRGRSVRLVALI